MPDYLLPGTEDHLDDAVQGGLVLASHGWSHANLTRLSAMELETELQRPLGWLRERFQPVRPWLAYPYGISSGAVEQAAAAAGYQAAFRVDGGRLGDRDRNPYGLARLNVPRGLSLEGFWLRTAGLFS